jgi:hypothetical protein
MTERWHIIFSFPTCLFHLILSNLITFIIFGEEFKVLPALHYLSTMPWRHEGKYSYNSTILDLGTRWMWMVSFTLYPQGKSSRYPLDRKLGGPQSRCGRCGVKKISFLCRESNSSRPTRSSSLNRLSDPGFSNIWYIVQIMKFLFIQFSPASCCFHRLGVSKSKYSPQLPALKYF